MVNRTKTDKKYGSHKQGGWEIIFLPLVFQDTYVHVCIYICMYI